MVNNHGDSFRPLWIRLFLFQMAELMAEINGVYQVALTNWAVPPSGTPSRKTPGFSHFTSLTMVILTNHLHPVGAF